MRLAATPHQHHQNQRVRQRNVRRHRMTRRNHSFVIKCHLDARPVSKMSGTVIFPELNFSGSALPLYPTCPQDTAKSVRHLSAGHEQRSKACCRPELPVGSEHKHQGVLAHCAGWPLPDRLGVTCCSMQQPSLPATQNYRSSIIKKYSKRTQRRRNLAIKPIHSLNIILTVLLHNMSAPSGHLRVTKRRMRQYCPSKLEKAQEKTMNGAWSCSTMMETHQDEEIA